MPVKFDFLFWLRRNWPIKFSLYRNWATFTESGLGWIWAESGLTSVTCPPIYHLSPTRQHTGDSPLPVPLHHCVCPVVRVLHPSPRLWPGRVRRPRWGAGRCSPWTLKVTVVRRPGSGAHCHQNSTPWEAAPRTLTRTSGQRRGGITYHTHTNKQRHTQLTVRRNETLILKKTSFI